MSDGIGPESMGEPLLGPSKAGEDEAQKALDLILEAMPGFEGIINRRQDLLQVRGPLFINGNAALDWLYMVPRHGAEAFAREMVQMTQRLAAEKLGLQAYIDEEKRRSYEEGKRDGEQSGYLKGIEAGRAQMLAEILSDIREDDDDSER